MRARIHDRIGAALERHLPEQRLFLKSDQGMRFVRLRPGTQLGMLTGAVLLMGWTVIVTSIFLIDTISAGNAREQAERQQAVYQERLNALSEERSLRVTEARQAQERFAVAMEQVSDMQSRLLASEERRRELEVAVDVIQTTLRRVIDERDEARAEAAQYLAEIEAETGVILSAAARHRDIERTLDALTAALDAIAGERDDAERLVAEAREQVERLEFEAELAAERNERVFSQIEAAVAMSLAPLEDMFSTVDMPAEQIIDQLRQTYSGQGGPLTPISMSTRGEAPDELSQRANEVLGMLDEANYFRIAVERLPFAHPVRGSYRYTSGFGMRRDPFNGSRRMHSGSDFAGPVGTPIVAPADGVVTFAGRRSGYGNTIEIRHGFGIETRFAHLSRIRVSEGERVSRGDRIGDMGNTGRSTGSHLHYEVHRNGDPIDPMTFITAGRDVF